MHMHKLNIKNNFKKERKQCSSPEYLPHIKHHSSETRVPQILTPTSMHTAWKLRPSLPFSSGLKNSQETKEREKDRERRRRKKEKKERKEKTIKRIILLDTWNLYEVWMPRSINTVLLEHSHAHSSMSVATSGGAVTETSGPKAWNIYPLAF